MTFPALPVPQSTAIPDAINALFNMLTAAFASDGRVQVYFGPLTKFVSPVTIQITEVTGDQNPAEIAPRRRREEAFAIVCSVVTWAGDQSSAAFLQRMNDAWSYFKQVAPAIGNNPKLIDPNTGIATVRFAQVGNFVGHPEITVMGQSIYTIDFHVRCAQRVESTTSS